jgi:Protein of unknown function (DUF2909)
MSYLVMLAFVAILGSLAAALLYMLRRPGDNPHGEEESALRSRRMARALALRVGFSILLFVTVLFAYWMGWIQPTGIRPGQ